MKTNNICSTRKNRSDKECLSKLKVFWSDGGLGANCNRLQEASGLTSRGMIYKNFESKYMREFVSLPDVGSDTTISIETNPS